MKNMKKVLASVLAIAMLTTSMSVNVAFGASDSTTPEAAANRLKSVGVLKGNQDGDLNLSESITRAEAAMIMVRMLGEEKSAEFSAGMVSYSDMAGHWAAGAVEVARSHGLIKGNPDGTFKPDDKVTYAQMATMMVRALGAGEVVESRGAWPMNVMTFASANKLTKDVKAQLNAPMLRGQVAILADNTLDAPLWEVTGYTTDGVEISENEDNETLLTEKLELEKKEGYVVTKELFVDNDKYKIEVSFDENEDGDYSDDKDVDGKAYKFVEGAEQEVIAGQEVDFWLDDDSKIVMIQLAEDTEQELVKFDEITNLNDSKDEIELDDDDDYDIENNCTVTINGETSTVAKLEDKVEDDELVVEGTVVLDDDGDVTHINAFIYDKAMLVDEVDYDDDDNEIKLEANDDEKHTDGSVKYKLDDVVVTVTGAKDDVKDIEEGDFIVYTKEANDKVFIKVLDGEFVEGDIEGKHKDEIEIDGKEYEIIENFKGDLRENFKVDDEVKVYVTKDGKVVTLDKLAGSNGSGDYAIITEFYAYEDKEEDETVAKVRLFDLASGAYLDRAILDAEETDEEDDEFLGYDFYDENGENETRLAAYRLIEAEDFADVADTVSILGKTFTKAANNDGNNFMNAAGLVADIEAIYPNAEYANDMVVATEEEDEENNKTGNVVVEVKLQNFVGRVVEYDIKSNDKVVLYNVDKDEIEEDSFNLDVSKGKFARSSASNMYVEEDTVKVYQAVEVDDYDLDIDKLSFDDLKDNTGLEAVLIELDDDEKFAEYVYITMAASELVEKDSKVKQPLDKSNDDYVGIVTNVREKSNEDVEVKVLTNEGEIKFRVEEDEAEDIDVKPVGKTSTIGLNSESALEGALEGVLVSFSMDDEGYVTSENAEWSNDIRVAKFYEVSSKDEVELRDKATDDEVEFDAYTNMFTVDSDITRVFGEDFVSGKMTIESRGNGWLPIKVEFEAQGEKNKDTEVDVDKKSTGYEITVKLGTASDSTTVNATIKNVADAIEDDDDADELVKVLYDDDNDDVVVAAEAHTLGLVKTELEDIVAADVSDIDDADEGDDFLEAEKDDANTVYYYLVEVDEDEELVDIHVDHVDGDNTQAVAIMIYDDDEF